MGVFTRDSVPALPSARTHLTLSNCNVGMLTPPVTGGEASGLWGPERAQARREEGTFWIHGQFSPPPVMAAVH